MTSWLSSTDVTKVPQSIPLLGWDLAAWRLADADPSLRSTVVGIVCVEGLVDRQALLSKVNSAVLHNPVLRSSVVSTPSGPALQELERFDASSCVRLLDAAIEGGALGTHDVAAVAHSLVESEFSTELPLWRLVVISQTHRSYIVAALHHAIADGNGALGLAAYLFDEFVIEPVSEGSGASPHTADIDTRSALTAVAGRVLQRAMRDPQGLARDINMLLKSATNLLNVPQQVHAQAMTRRSADFGQVFFSFPKSVVRGAISGRGVSQHDALVAVVCRALYLYHEQSGVTLEKLRINVPVALSVENAAANQLVVARLEVQLDDPTPAALMEQSNALLHSWRSEPALVLAAELIEASRLLPSAMLASVVKKADATISSLRGVPRLGHIGGHTVSSIWPLVAPVGAAVSVTSVGVGSDVTMCVTHDCAAVEDAALWQRSLTMAMSETAGLRLIEHKFE